MNTILVMNLTGSVMALAYFLLKKIGGERLPKKTLYGFLRAIVLAFLIPLWPLGELYESVAILFPVNFTLQARFTSRDLVVLETEKGAMIFSHGLRMERNLVIAYLVIAIFMAAFWMIRDWWNQRGIRNAVAFGENRENPLLTKLCSEYGIRQKIECFSCEDRMVAAVLGIRRPLLLYKAPGTQLEQELMLSHELYHVKRGDVVWRVMANLVRGLHFWNPVVHLLWSELNVICEQSCDEWVIQGRDSAQRQVYAKLLVDYSGPSFAKSGATLLALGVFDTDPDNGKGDGLRDVGELWDVSSDDRTKHKESRLEKRIRLIMGYDEKNKLRRGVGNLLAGLLIFFCSLTTLAYENVRIYPVLEDMGANWTDGTEVTVFVDGKYEELFLEEDEIRYSAQYQDELGNIHPLTESESNVRSMYASRILSDETVTSDGVPVNKRSVNCGADEVWLQESRMIRECIDHEFEEVVMTYHTADSKGSCTVEVIAARRCAKCGAVEGKVEKRKTFSVNCTHTLSE